MKILFFAILLLLCLTGLDVQAQTDSSIVRKPAYHPASHSDSLYLARLNTNSNLMIAGGVGLCGVGGYLLYYGVSVYSSAADPASTNPANDINRNHNQGTVFLAAGGLSIAGGMALVVLGALRKHDFKVQKKMMSIQGSMLPNGRMQLAFNF